MNQTDLFKALAIMEERFGHDTLLSLATVDGTPMKTTRTPVFSGFA